MQLSDSDTAALTTEYAEQERSYETLVDEAKFTLHTALSNAGIKVHIVEGRVKSLPSILEKCGRRELPATLDGLDDIAGVRVVCLFRDDLARVEEVIRSEFDVYATDDKINATTDSFGYMSVHFLCKIKDTHSGPRYDAIKGMPLEIQLRTICMHAWAAVSHYLDYKQELDVPDHLKKSLNALSGLFYVADSSFQQFAKEAQQSRSQAQRSTRRTLNNDTLIPINLDTLTAYLEKIFPARAMAHPGTSSEFISELNAIGLRHINALDSLISAGENGIKDWDRELGKKHKLNRIRSGQSSCTICISRISTA